MATGLGKRKTEFKPVKLHLRTDLVSYSVSEVGWVLWHKTLLVI